MFVPFFRKNAYTVSRCSLVHKWERVFFLLVIDKTHKLHNHRSFVQNFHTTKGTPEGMTGHGWIGITLLSKKKTVVNALLLTFRPFLELLYVLL